MRNSTVRPAQYLYFEKVSSDSAVKVSISITSSSSNVRVATHALASGQVGSHCRSIRRRLGADSNGGRRGCHGRVVVDGR